MVVHPTNVKKQVKVLTIHVIQGKKWQFAPAGIFDPVIAKTLYDNKVWPN